MYGSPSFHHAYASGAAAIHLVRALNSLASAPRFERYANWWVGNAHYGKAIDEGIICEGIATGTPVVAIEASYANESLIRLTEIVTRLVSSELGIPLAIGVKIFGHRPGMERRVIVLAATELSPSVITYDTFYGGEESISVPASPFGLESQVGPQFAINLKDIAAVVTERMRQADQALNK